MTLAVAEALNPNKPKPKPVHIGRCKPDLRRRPNLDLVVLGLLKQGQWDKTGAHNLGPVSAGHVACRKLNRRDLYHPSHHTCVTLYVNVDTSRSRGPQPSSYVEQENCDNKHPKQAIHNLFLCFDVMT